MIHGYFESHFESRIVPTLESKDNSAEEEMRNDEKMALESIYADAFRDEYIEVALRYSPHAKIMFCFR